MKRFRVAFETLISGIPVRRKPVLRRADEPEYLFATDLPEVTEESDLKAFCLIAESKGWRIQKKGTWLLLDPGVEDSTIPCTVSCSDAYACISLLERHHESVFEPMWTRRILKSVEAGQKDQEKCFSELHGMMSERLRRKMPLPYINLQRTDEIE